MSASRSILWAVAVLLLAPVAAGASDRYDPRLRFRTITTPAFQIHYHQGEEALARRLAVIAERVATELAPSFGRPLGRVHVILVSQNDLANGWATPFPYNVIEITATEPPGVSSIGNVSDWLRVVFVHEYTHILHLDRSRGFFAGLRRVVGRNPAVMPNIFVPPWQIEGIATWQETASTGEGRVRAGDFRQLLDRAAGARRFASLDRASSERVQWPSGHTPYVYGGLFHQYLADTYGEASIARLTDATASRLPYLGAPAFERVFNRSLGALWRDFAAAAPGAAGEAPAAARLTHHGFVVSSPAYTPDGRLLYSVSNPDGFPALMQRREDGSLSQVTTRVGGDRLGVTRDVVVFDQLEYVRSVGLQTDLFAVALDSGTVTRLTRQARAGDPDLSADGATIVCTIQEPDRRALATVSRNAAGAAPRILVSQPGVSFASPRWSPDGRFIAAERREPGRLSQVVLIEAATGTVVRTLSTVDGRSVTPSWTADGRTVLFATASRAPFEIHRADISDGRVERLSNPGVSGHSPIVSPDGSTLTFVGSTADGADLFSVRWSDAQWSATETRAAVQSSDAPPSGSAPPLADAPYRPGTTLLPRYWTPIVTSDNDELSIGAATGGSDPLARHSYSAGAAWSTRARPDWFAGYVYDRWRPSVFLYVSDDTDPWRSGTVRSLEANAGLVLPFRTFRRTQSLFGAVHASSDAFDCDGCEPQVDQTIRRHALRGGWSIRTAKLYGYSISAEEGVIATVSAEWAPRAFGSTGTSTAGVIDVRAFLPAAPRRSVIALRVASAASWGDDQAARLFGAGGPGPQYGGVSFDGDAIGLIRGFDSSDVVGRHAVVANADYRFPLVWIERGVGTWPFSLRSLHGSVFADAGAAWNDHLGRRDRRGSIGAELSADVVVGFVLPFTVASGVAWRFDPTRANDGAAFFARVGRAF